MECIVGKEGESGVEGRVRGNGAYLVWREEQVLPDVVGLSARVKQT